MKWFGRMCGRAKASVLRSGCGEGPTARDDRVVITLEEAGEIWDAVSSCICLKSARVFQKSRSRETNNTYQLVYAPTAKAPLIICRSVWNICLPAQYVWLMCSWMFPQG